MNCIHLHIWLVPLKGGVLCQGTVDRMCCFIKRSEPYGSVKDSNLLPSTGTRKVCIMRVTSCSSFLCLSASCYESYVMVKNGLQFACVQLFTLGYMSVFYVQQVIQGVSSAVLQFSGLYSQHQLCFLSSYHCRTKLSIENAYLKKESWVLKYQFSVVKLSVQQYQHFRWFIYNNFQKSWYNKAQFPVFVVH